VTPLGDNTPNESGKHVYLKFSRKKSTHTSGLLLILVHQAVFHIKSNFEPNRGIAEHLKISIRDQSSGGPQKRVRWLPVTGYSIEFLKIPESVSYVGCCPG
jgi:hypothetical protein